MQVSSAEISIEKKEAEVALEAAIPALEEAAAALNDLKKDDITEIRSFAKPHVLVQKVITLLKPAVLAHLFPDQDLHHLSVSRWSLPQLNVCLHAIALAGITCSSELQWLHACHMSS